MRLVQHIKQDRLGRVAVTTIRYVCIRTWNDVLICLHVNNLMQGRCQALSRKHGKVFLEFLWYAWVRKLFPRCSWWSKSLQRRRCWWIACFRYHVSRAIKSMFWIQVGLLLCFEMFRVRPLRHRLRMFLSVQRGCKRTCQQPCVSHQMHQYDDTVRIAFYLSSACVGVFACPETRSAPECFSFKPCSNPINMQNHQNDVCHKFICIRSKRAK